MGFTLAQLLPPTFPQAYCEGVMGTSFVKQDAFDAATVLQESSRCVGLAGWLVVLIASWW